MKLTEVDKCWYEPFLIGPESLRRRGKTIQILLADPDSGLPFKGPCDRFPLCAMMAPCLLSSPGTEQVLILGGLEFLPKLVSGIR